MPRVRYTYDDAGPARYRAPAQDVVDAANADIERGRVREAMERFLVDAPRHDYERRRREAEAAYRQAEQRHRELRDQLRDQEWLQMYQARPRLTVTAPADFTNVQYNDLTLRIVRDVGNPNATLSVGFAESQPPTVHQYKLVGEDGALERS